MKRYLLLLMIITSANSVTAQSADQRTWNWYFGSNLAMVFIDSTLPPIPIASSSMFANEGSSAISDSGGNLLFYTNGQQAWSYNDVIMPNGSGLNGHYWSAQSGLLVPMPGSNTLFYLFTVSDWQQTIGGLAYSVIDKSLNSGLGDVIPLQKNIPVNSNCREQLTAVYHSNGQDIWIISHESGNNNFVAYLLTSQGLFMTPVVSPAGAMYNGINRFGYLHVSPSCTKIGSSFGERDLITQDTTVQVCDFNSTTGAITNAVFLADFTVIPAAYGCEFSPDNTKFYVTEYNGTHIYQFDLTAPNIAATQTNIAPANGVIRASLALGPDDKIYVTRPGHGELGAIDFPDSTGVACNYTDAEVLLPSGSNTIGICNSFHSCTGSTAVFTNDLNPLQSDLTIFPNPAVDFITVNCFSAGHQENSTKNKIRISDVTGRIIFENEPHTLNNRLNSRINVSSFSPGIYFLRVDLGGEVFLKKIVVE